VGDSIRIGILTVSDRASRGEYADEGGPAVHDYLREVLSVSWEPEIQIVSDEVDCVAAAIEDYVQAMDAVLLSQQAVQGPAPRDITPEATERVCSKMLTWDLANSCGRYHFNMYPPAILSRQTAGCMWWCIRSLISQAVPKSICECLDAVFPCNSLLH
jgi:molybdopterin adenylyltransferase